VYLYIQYLAHLAVLNLDDGARRRLEEVRLLLLLLRLLLQLLWRCHFDHLPKGRISLVRN
jgi:hypothetical protein